MMVLATSCFAQTISLEASSAKPAACRPDWVTNESTFSLAADTAVFLTHFSTRLDSQRHTEKTLHGLVDLAKSSELPFVYLHEPHQDDSTYFYNDCQPTAWIASSIGHFQFDSSPVKHAIVAGGYYELCLNNTVTQLIGNWYRSQPSHDLKLTYVLGGVYAVAQDRDVGSSSDSLIQSWLSAQPDTTIRLLDVMNILKSRNDAWDFLSRRWSKVPADVGLTVYFRGEKTAIRFAQPNRPTLTIQYMTLSELAEDLENPGDKGIAAVRILSSTEGISTAETLEATTLTEAAEDNATGADASAAKQEALRVGATNSSK